MRAMHFDLTRAGDKVDLIFFEIEEPNQDNLLDVTLTTVQVKLF